MAITRLSNSGITTGVLKYDSALAGYPPVMAAPTAADGGTGTTATVSFTTISGATNYRAISTPGSFTGTSATSPITVSGLTTGVAYTFQIQAQNSVGYGGLSAASNSVTPVAPGSYELIASAVATGGENNLTFTSIPQTYKHLQIRTSLRRNVGGSMQVYLRLNGATSGGPYAYTYIYGNAGALTQTYSAVNNILYVGETTTTSTAISDNFGIALIDILDYSNTNKATTTTHRAGYADDGTYYIFLSSGFYNSTSAVTQVQVWFAGDTLQAGSKAALYGIKV